ncbi:MAG: alcohol dehydrogenase catalytic domain-containing protein [Candidatus Rokubacteria bacterium]|nr:alcohol dehydrogenase catalytic domain-containing protein [Candidatus Rokubacteria bacterium]
MKAAVLHDGGRLQTENWPRPAIGPGEILVSLRGCGLCGSDIVKILSPEAKTPAVLGHELVGTVTEVGAGVADFGVGDRVVAAHHVPCGDCHYCHRGSHSMCRAFKESHLDPGGFAEFVRVPAANVRHVTFIVPAAVSDEAASFVEPLGCCVRAVRRAGVRAGDTVAVVGLGTIGCLFAQLLRRAGAAVVGVDPLAERRHLARRLGVEAADPERAGGVVRELSRGRGADQVVVTGGGADVLGWAVDAVRDGGAVHFFAGGGGSSLPVGLGTLYHRELTITTTYSSSPADLAEAFALIAAGHVVMDGFITHSVPLERLAEGVELMRRRAALKVWVTP